MVLSGLQNTLWPGRLWCLISQPSSHISKASMLKLTLSNDTHTLCSISKAMGSMRKYTDNCAHSGIKVDLPSW